MKAKLLITLALIAISGCATSPRGSNPVSDFLYGPNSASVEEIIKMNDLAWSKYRSGTPIDSACSEAQGQLKIRSMSAANEIAACSMKLRVRVNDERVRQGVAEASKENIIDIDITNNPDKDFLLGYKRDYPGDCTVTWWASRWNTEHIISIGKCRGTTEKLVYSNMMKDMQYVKSHTKFANFSDYLRDREKNAAKIDEQNKLLCVDTMAGVYIFLPAEAQNKPGWFYISKIYNGRHLASDIVGFWKKNANGTITADFGLSAIAVNMANVKDCRHL